MNTTEVKNTNNVCNKNQTLKAIQSRPIRLTGPDHDCILDEIKCRDTIENI